MEKTYSIINIADLSSIDFSQVYETNENTIRKSIDELQFVIKYSTEPSFISDGTVTPVQTLSHENCLNLMVTPDWTPEEPE
tara:strand:- start:165 stop:407 length:243 start_codon:yes stop_codon:yes gene_type:complete